MKYDLDMSKGGGHCCPMRTLTLLTRKIGKLFRCHMHKLNVTNSQVGIFMILLQKKESTQNELGKMLDLERSTISRDLSRLVCKGYLYKVSGTKSPLVGLTQKGGELATKIHVEWEKGYVEAKALLGEDGMAALLLLEKKMLTKKE